MCVATISLLKGKPNEYLKAVSDAVYEALVTSYEMAENDRFHIIHQLEPNELLFDRHYMGGPRSDDFMLINIHGPAHPVKVKQAFFKTLVRLLHDYTGVRSEDIFISILTSATEDWSFGSGESLLPPA